jgi:hypothetical protein
MGGRGVYLLCLCELCLKGRHLRLQLLHNTYDMTQV